MRRSDREITDRTKILSILDGAKILHLGLFAERYPYVVPMHYGYTEEAGRFVFYLHSAREGRKLDLIRRDPNVCIQLETDVAPISGGEIPCRYGAAYSSIIARGKAEVVEDEQEKIRGLTLLMRGQTRRDFAISGEMAASVAVIKVTVEELTAKSRPL